MQSFGVMAVLPFLMGVFALSSCDGPQSTTSTNPSSAEQDLGAPSPSGRDFKQRQMAFLNRIRESDPQQRTIDRALLNDENELGLILDRSVEMEKIPALMKTMLIQMAKEFPGQDLTVLAYTPSNPPRKIGTARLNGRTRAMTYVPEQ